MEIVIKECLYKFVLDIGSLKSFRASLESHIQLVTECVIKGIEYKYGHSGSKCENKITYHRD